MNAKLSSLKFNADAAIITSNVNRRYYTGFPSSAGTLLILGDKRVLFVDFRYIEAARKAADGYEVEMIKYPIGRIKELLLKAGAKSLAIEVDRTTVKEYERLKKELDGIEVVDGGLARAIELQRAVKSHDEYLLMQKAQDIADKSYGQLLSQIGAGMTERQVAVRLASLIRENGAERESFDTIVVSGQNSSMPHGVPSDRKLQNGDLVTIDFGVKLNGYCSDMTRTFAIGKIGDEEKRVYDTVLQAQQAAFSAIKLGTPCRNVDAAARELIYNAGYEGCFEHTLGHSLGLEIHEGPRFSPTEEALVEPGLVLSVEPGIYLSGRFGCRIEDVVYITEDGFINLTHSPKELITL